MRSPVYFISSLVITSVLFCFSSLASGLEEPDISKMTLPQKVGQLLIVGFDGQTLSPRIRLHLQQLQPGGIILFKKNLGEAASIQALTSSLTELGAPPFLIGVDQEGGAVARIKFTPAQPSARWVGLTGSPALAFDLGRKVGETLVGLGINMNFAPVLDVGSAHRGGDFLKSRTFSPDPKVVDAIGSSYALGVASAGVLPTAKHFPGIGGIKEDPHLKTIHVGASLDRLKKANLTAFKTFLANENSAVMLSHAHYAALAAAGPSPYSHEITTVLLREKMDYQGLVITDDLLMAGASLEGGDFDHRLLQAFLAGSDMLMLSWSTRAQRHAKNVLLRALQDRKISLQALDDRVRRILKIKSWLSRQKNSRSLATELNFDLSQIIQKMKSVRASRSGQ